QRLYLPLRIPVHPTSPGKATILDRRYQVDDRNASLIALMAIVSPVTGNQTSGPNYHGTRPALKAPQDCEACDGDRPWRASPRDRVRRRGDSAGGTSW